MDKDGAPETGETHEESEGHEVSREEEHELWGLLIQTRDLLVNLRDREVRHLGITSMQGGALWVVRALEMEGTAATPAEISRRLFRQPPPTLALLNRMAKLGLITSTESSEGRRQVRVALTEKGRETFRAYMRARKVVPRVLGSISAEERLQLRSSLARVRQKAREELVWVPPYQ